MTDVYLLTLGIVLFQMLVVNPLLKKLFKIEK
jgi:hypothetical protein